MPGVVTDLFIASDHGRPVDAVDHVVAISGEGLEHDRYRRTRRQVTLVCGGELAAAAAELAIPSVPVAATRRNIGVDLPALPRRHGASIRIGDVELAVWRDCAPCSVMDETVGAGAGRALRGRAGISATVVSGGVIRIGDPVHL